MSEIGGEIRRIREQKGWSQAELAVYAGSSQPTVNQIESGKRNPSTATLVKLARALEVEVADFFPKVQASLSFEDIADEECRQEEVTQERLVEHFFALYPSIEDRVFYLENTVDILRHYYDLGHKMLSLMKEDLEFHGTAIVWDPWYYQCLLPSIENDGTLAYADFVEKEGSEKASQREVAACRQIIYYVIEMLNLIVDMRRVHHENNAYVTTAVGRGMEEMTEYLESVRKNAPQRGS